MLDRAIIFFYLALLDEAKAKEAIHDVVKSLRKKGVQNNPEQSENLERLISTLHSVYDNYTSKARPMGTVFSSGNLVLPTGLNWGRWLEFHRQADKNDLLAVIFNKILGISEDVVARGLGVSDGTVRFRVSKGLRLLGGLNA